ncbi:ComEA family DNA-binding protein [Ramlibacter alkalitolerans]|uniref:Helix-hairpin-helix domain-containing protein n=1 Tax=Ramlibacter alkalitolerans TaxID=2039631 RepID=A0ABS1JNB7_9BURK|nr:helix-hairpin-helix domain-containing protein [Ramlibacter alkalitolerans]MBL0425762.1 helix-hairpin-helix domain-containing protein [Ramlibacter alkalitolerans]
MLKKILAILAMLYAAAAFAGVEVNKATAAELDGIKGIGPVMSKRILDERKKGQFKNWDNFMGRIKGIAPITAARYSAGGLTVNGETYQRDLGGNSGAAPAKKDEKKEAKAETKAEAKADKKDDKAAAAKPAASAKK